MLHISYSFVVSLGIQTGDPLDHRLAFSNFCTFPKRHNEPPRSHFLSERGQRSKHSSEKVQEQELNLRGKAAKVQRHALKDLADPDHFNEQSGSLEGIKDIEPLGLHTPVLLISVDLCFTDTMLFGFRQKISNPLYRTSNQTYGSKKPTVHEMPVR